MGLAEQETTRELQLKLRKVFKGLLKPVKVKSIVITKMDRYSVHGFLLTVCPIEKRESGRDFEVGLEGNKEGSILSVSVDGRRLLPRRTRATASKRSSGPGVADHQPNSS